MRLLFITRKFPPAVGGMENLSFALSKEFEKSVYTKKIVWGGSQKWLPYFLPKAFIQGLYYIFRYNITHVHLGDGLLAPLGLVLKILTGRKVSVTACGLDVTFKNKFYQAVVPRCLARLDRIICISSATLHECLKRGIPENKCTVIPCGVYPDDFVVESSRDNLQRIIGKDVQNKKVLVTVGRLVKRKGVRWFVENVLPKLDDRYIYAIIGDGEERTAIEESIIRLNLKEKAILLGKLPNNDVKIVLNTADIFVMPNIPVEGDIEGFGIVAIEASAAGLPVVASDFEGIRDAVVKDQTAVLVSPLNAEAFASAIEKMEMFDKKVIRELTVRNYSWGSLIKRYLDFINYA